MKTFKKIEQSEDIKINSNGIMFKIGDKIGSSQWMNKGDRDVITSFYIQEGVIKANTRKHWLTSIDKAFHN